MSSHSPNRPCAASVPVSRKCTNASGQTAYTDQCTARQSRNGSRCRTRLVAITTRITSNAIVPSETHSRRYGDVPGITIAHQPTRTNVSSTVVTMCVSMNPSASNATLRCKSCVANRGQCRVTNDRWVAAIPRNMLTVSSTNATMPVLRVVYHNGADEKVFTTRTLAATR
jgi:ABC-type Fe2+-enterobactin transport system substrate-binding protein